MKNQNIIFKRNKFKDLMLLLISLAFVFGGYFTLEKNPQKSWLGILFFGFWAICILIQLITNTAYLRLYEEGFEQKGIFWKKKYFWNDIKYFWKSSFRGNKKICFNYTEEYNRKNGKNKFYYFLNSKHGAITSSYNINTEDLLKLMTNYKRRSKKR